MIFINFSYDIIRIIALTCQCIRIEYVSYLMIWIPHLFQKSPINDYQPKSQERRANHASI